MTNQCPELVSKPLLLSWDYDGGFRIRVGKEEYTYVVAGDKIAKTIQLWAHSPWKGLNYLKVNFKYYRKEGR